MNRLIAVMIVILTCLIIMLGITSCSNKNTDEMNYGSVIISYTGDKIVDVYKVSNTYAISDNFISFYHNNNVIAIHMPYKVMLCATQAEYDKYYKFHQETSIITYEEFIRTRIGVQ
jgi:hypothetical protein